MNALLKIPSLKEKYAEQNRRMAKDVPVLEKMVGSPWRKEEELRKLKTELSNLERKIKMALEAQSEPATTKHVEEQKKEEKTVAVVAEPRAGYRKVR